MLARQASKNLVNPRSLGSVLVSSTQVQTWAYDPSQHPNAFMGRVAYYDAVPDDEQNRREDTEAYWRAIEVLPDVHLGFGALRGLKRTMRQKGVDTLMAVDMLVGAFSGLFDIAVIVAGDADFVPVVEELKRRGVMVTVAGFPDSISQDLLRAADRFVEILRNDDWFPPMIEGGKRWPA